MNPTFALGLGTLLQKIAHGLPVSLFPFPKNPRILENLVKSRNIQNISPADGSSIELFQKWTVIILKSKPLVYMIIESKYHTHNDFVNMLKPYKNSFDCAYDFRE